MVVVGAVNIIALVVFTVALCWRLDQIRRTGGGLQALAMTVSIAALVLAFVVYGNDVTEAIDSLFFTGAARVVFYALLALGVASLIIVFFFPAPGVTRERRAGIEAVPLVVALIGLQVTMLVTPLDLRTEKLTEFSVRNVAFGLFFLIASLYLAYGFIACVRNIRRFLTLAEGYLRTSLLLLVGGLTMLAISSLLQIVFVVAGMAGVTRLPLMLVLSQWMAVLGVVAFLVGISYPMVHARWRSMMTHRRRRQSDEDLVPLWRLVTDAVPEVVLPVEGRMTATERFHRRVVETRDALTQISPYIPQTFEYVQGDAVRAAMLRGAVDDYVAAGRVSGEVRDLLPSEGEGLDADAAPLVRLSLALLTEPATQGAHRAA